MGQDSSKDGLLVKIIDGDTQSSQLFDFQQIGIVQQQTVIKSPSYILSDGLRIKYQQSMESEQQVFQPSVIYEITQTPYKEICIRDIGAQPKVIWRVIQEGQSYPIKCGDTLKVGKIKLDFKRLVDKKSQMNEDETVKDQDKSPNAEGSLVQHVNDAESVKTDKSTCDRCRICFRSYDNKSDPLVCLCKCSGSIKFIHYACLKDWISNNVTRRQDDYCKFYSYFESCCELCKHPIPSQFQHNGKNYSLLSFNNFAAPYAQFEYSEVQNNKKKVFKYFINLGKDKEVTVGRNNSSQVIMKDISISRTHCSLEYKQGILVIRDKKSKFGTLVKVNKQIQFQSQNGLKLQFDSKIIQLYQKGSIKNCCCMDLDNYKVTFESSFLKQSTLKPLKQMQLSEQGQMQQLQEEYAQQESNLSGQLSFNNRITMIRDRQSSVH